MYATCSMISIQALPPYDETSDDFVGRLTRDVFDKLNVEDAALRGRVLARYLQEMDGPNLQALWLLVCKALDTPQGVIDQGTQFRKDRVISFPLSTVRPDPSGNPVSLRVVEYDHVQVGPITAFWPPPLEGAWVAANASWAWEVIGTVGTDQWKVEPAALAEFEDWVKTEGSGLFRLVRARFYLLWAKSLRVDGNGCCSLSSTTARASRQRLGPFVSCVDRRLRPTRTVTSLLRVEFSSSSAIGALSVRFLPPGGVITTTFSAPFWER